jgi:hypothetical protein
MQEDKIVQVLERIATALEKIAINIAHKHINNFSSYQISGDKTEDEESQNTSENIFINDISEIEEFLNSRGISIKVVKQEDDADEVLDNIAFFMGNRYKSIKKLYSLIKRNLNSGRSFKLDLKNSTQEEIASVTQLCTNLHQIAFLEEYKYFRSPKFYLFSKVNNIPKALNFFSGGWLERYIKTAIEESIKSASHPVKLNYSYLKNPQIILPNGNDFELDIIYKIEDEIFWCEAKTGDYQRYVQKYSNMSKILNIDEDHAFMILTDISEGGAKALKSIFKMNVVNIDHFYNIFTAEVMRIKNKIHEAGEKPENNENIT